MEQKGIQIGKEAVKLFLFADDIHKSVAFLYTNSELFKKEFKKTIPFIITSKIINCLGINLIKEVKDWYIENYKTLMKEM